MTSTAHETSTTTTPTPDETTVEPLAPRTLGVARNIGLAGLIAKDAAIAKGDAKVKDLRVGFGVAIAYAVANGSVVAPEGVRLNEHLVATFGAGCESKGQADNLRVTGNALIVLGDEATLPIGQAVLTCRNYGVSVVDLMAQAHASIGKSEEQIVAAFTLLGKDAADKRDARADAAKAKRAEQAAATEDAETISVKVTASTTERLAMATLAIMTLKGADVATPADVAALSALAAQVERIVNESGQTADTLAAAVA